jgi:hypothetical protein
MERAGVRVHYHLFYPPPLNPSRRGRGVWLWITMAAMEDGSPICCGRTSCINTENLLKFGMEEVLKNYRKGGALRHRVR